jgi:hypothetical protein
MMSVPDIAWSLRIAKLTENLYSGGVGNQVRMPGIFSLSQQQMDLINGAPRQRQDMFPSGQVRSGQ